MQNQCRWVSRTKGAATFDSATAVVFGLSSVMLLLGAARYALSGRAWTGVALTVTAVMLWLAIAFKLRRRSEPRGP